MTVIGTVGLPGSGKSEAATVARGLDIPVVTMGDVIRQACRDRGLDPATHHGEMARTLREENGPDAIAQRSLPRIREHLADSETVLVDGIRSDVEVERFVEAFGEEFLLVEITAPDEERAERLDLRGRDASAEAGGESIEKRDERELGFGMGEAMAVADCTVRNDGTLEAFHERVRTLLTEGVDAATDLEGIEAIGANEANQPAEHTDHT
jgi:dephospho-CoA kinase